jgi:transposase, IS30 family
VERKTRHVISRKIPDKSQASVLRAIKAIESRFGARRFRSLFKSITADNGSEFLDVEALQRCAFSKRQRTQLFYAHPYASWERGSNENADRRIRRFIAKGRDIARFTHKAIQEVACWINEDPRKLLDYLTPQQLFTDEMKAISYIKPDHTMRHLYLQPTLRVPWSIMFSFGRPIAPSSLPIV